MRRTVTALAACWALASPAAALAQGDPFGPQPAPTPVPAQTTTTSQPAPQTSDSGSLSGLQQGLIIAAGGVLLLGIGWAIVSDARQRAPVAAGEPTASERAERRSAQQQARARAKAKAARAQRKRNRTRR